MKKCVCGEEMTPAEWKNQWVCHRCGRTKPMRTTVTNADRIRAMSDEELVEFIKNIKVRAVFCKAVKDNDAFEELCSAEWLQQPAEEDENA